MRGTIKKITRDREYGFIRAEDGVDYFFHQNELHGGLVFKDITEGDPVKFEPTQADRGPRATDIWPVN